MNKRRRAQPPLTPLRIVLLIGVIAVMIVIAIGLWRGLLGLLNLFSSDGGALEPDPMFPREEEQTAVEPPPELTESGAPPELGEDPSLNWVYEELTPVDQTAAELAQEAQVSE